MDAADGEDTERRAFTELYRTLLPAVRSYVRHRAGPDLVDDAATETFLVVWRRWAERPGDSAALRPWVFTIASHKVMHASHSRERERGLRRRLVALPSEEAQNPSDELATRDAVQQALSLLPEAEREALALRVWADLTVAQAAEVAGCTPSAMSTRLGRATARLRRLLAHDSRFEEAER